LSKIALAGAVSGTATFTIESPATSTNRTLTLPDNTGTIITQNSTPAFASTIGVGGATPAASGAGITFPATQSASSDANTLDDYEEGTWSPVLSDGTNNATMNAETSGIYVKIGRTVYITATVYTTSLGSVTGNIYVNGLPFTTANQNPKVSLAIGYADLLNISANQVISAFLDSNESRIRLRLWDSAAGTTALQASEWSSDGIAFITGTYYV